MIQLAGCVILDERKQVLLLHRHTAEFTHWELPGGKMEVGEKPAAAATRELQEELGVEVDILRRLGSDQFTDASGAYQYQWFLAKVKAGRPTIQEPHKFDGLEYHDLATIAMDQLSANMRKLKTALAGRKVKW